MKTAFFSTKKYDRDFFEKRNAENKVRHELAYFDDSLNEVTANLLNDFEAVCVFVNDDLNEKVISLLSKKGIKLIALRCAGFNNVDLSAAHKYGIKVVRVPNYSPHAVAEHAVAMILTLNRKTHRAYNRIRESNFSLDRLLGFDLNGKTVGVVGTGKIGKVFCHIMLGFGCKVTAFDVAEDKELLSKGVIYHSLEQIFRKADIISLQCPLTPATKHMINRDTIAMMKEGVMLINTSRGGLIDTRALITGLKSGKIGYLGIDVYEQEEGLFFHDHSDKIVQDDLIMRLITFPNVLITAHQAFFTDTALHNIASITLKNITGFERDNVLENEVIYLK